MYVKWQHCEIYIAAISVTMGHHIQMMMQSGSVVLILEHCWSVFLGIWNDAVSRRPANAVLNYFFLILFSHLKRCCNVCIL